MPVTDAMEAAARAAISDARGDFLPTYTGPHDPGLDFSYRPARRRRGEPLDLVRVPLLGRQQLIDAGCDSAERLRDGQDWPGD